MNDQDEVARSVLLLLERLGIPYMLTGSYASNIYGHTRATHDVDIVVELRESDVPGLVAGLGSDYYAEPEAAKEAVQLREQFNAIHIPSGTKVDFWVRPLTPFNESRFSRRVRAPLWDLQVSVGTPEDVILSKLVWYRKSNGVLEMQMRDAFGVLEVQRDRLDFEYLRRWADTLGVRDLLNRIAG